MAKRRKFVPGRKNGSVDLHRREEGDGGVKPLPPVVIPPEGLVTDDKEILEFLDDSPLKGQKNGFVEVDMPGELAKQDKKKKSTKQAEIKNVEVDEEFLKLPDDTEFPYHKAGGWYYLSDGTKIQAKEEEAKKAEKEIKKKAKQAAKAKKEEPEEEEEPEQPEKEVVEEVTNLNQLRDWLISEAEVEEDSLATKEDIENAASELDPPVEFPNYNS